MKRSIISCTAAILAVSTLTFGVPVAGAALLGKVQTHAQAAQCSTAVRGHSKVTKSQITACKSSPLASTQSCPKGPVVVFVDVGNNPYVLRQGHKPIKAGSGNRIATFNLCGNSAATGTSTTAVPPTPTVSTLLSGNAKPVVPIGPPRNFGIVFIGTPVVNSGGTTVPVVVVNNTGGTINDIDVSGPADVNGAVVASGDSQGFYPTNVVNGGASFGYVFFQSQVPAGAVFNGLTARANTRGASTYFLDGQVSGTSQTTDSLGDPSIVGTVSNPNSIPMTGPTTSTVLCFDSAGTLLGVQEGFISGDGALAPGMTGSFQDTLYGISCPTYLVGSTGFGHQ
jgi:hypothetical protein